MCRGSCRISCSITDCSRRVTTTAVSQIIILDHGSCHIACSVSFILLSGQLIDVFECLLYACQHSSYLLCLADCTESLSPASVCQSVSLSVSLRVFVSLSLFTSVSESEQRTFCVLWLRRRGGHMSHNDDSVSL